MKILHAIVGAALAVQAILLGGWMLGASAGGGGAGSLLGLTLVEEGRSDALSLGATLVLLAVLYALTMRSGQRRVLSFDNEGGTVSISTEAIRDFVARLAPEFPAVARLVPEVIVGRKSIDIRVGVRVKSGPQVQEVCELLQQRIRESLATSLGITQVRRVTVSVIDIVAEQKAL